MSEGSISERVLLILRSAGEVYVVEDGKARRLSFCAIGMPPAFWKHKKVPVLVWESEDADPYVLVVDVVASVKARNLNSALRAMRRQALRRMEA